MSRVRVRFSCGAEWEAKAWFQTWDTAEEVCPSHGHACPSVGNKEEDAR